MRRVAQVRRTLAVEADADDDAGLVDRAVVVLQTGQLDLDPRGRELGQAARAPRIVVERALDDPQVVLAALVQLLSRRVGFSLPRPHVPVQIVEIAREDLQLFAHAGVRYGPLCLEPQEALPRLFEVARGEVLGRQRARLRAGAQGGIRLTRERFHFGLEGGPPLLHLGDGLPRPLQLLLARRSLVSLAVQGQLGDRDRPLGRAPLLLRGVTGVPALGQLGRRPGQVGFPLAQRGNLPRQLCPVPLRFEP